VNVANGSLWRAFHSDPYAHVATMRRSCHWPHDFSYEDGPRGPATCSHSFGRHEHSLRAVPPVGIPCAVRRPRSSLDCAATWNCREAPQTLALSRADHGRRRHRFDDHPRDLQLATEIAQCVARPLRANYYVEVRLTALGSEPRNSSITAPDRSSSAHSRDMCIGVAC
jgi:hypothetical protein